MEQARHTSGPFHEAVAGPGASCPLLCLVPSLRWNWGIPGAAAAESGHSRDRPLRDSDSGASGSPAASMSWGFPGPAIPAHVWWSTVARPCHPGRAEEGPQCSPYHPPSSCNLAAEGVPPSRHQGPSCSIIRKCPHLSLMWTMQHPPWALGFVHSFLFLLLLY